MKNILVLGLSLVSSLAWCQVPPEMGKDSVNSAQSIADELRTATGADAAFVPVGVLKDSTAGKELAQCLQFPTDELSVVKLTGKQIKDALVRSISLFPSPNPAFLHLSNIEVKFNKAGTGESRIASVTIGGAALNAGSSYRVAMPSNLARGGLGYFTVWSKGAIEKDATIRTLESVLKGKSANDSPLRWKASS